MPALLPLLALLDGVALLPLWSCLQMLLQPAVEIAVGLYLLRGAAMIFEWAGFDKP